MGTPRQNAKPGTCTQIDEEPSNDSATHSERPASVLFLFTPQALNGLSDNNLDAREDRVRDAATQPVDPRNDA
jgi:hypothetical protein